MRSSANASAYSIRPHRSHRDQLTARLGRRLDRLVEEALAPFEARDRIAETVFREVRRLAVRLVGRFVVVDLVEEEHARVFRIAVRLVEAAPGLGSRKWINAWIAASTASSSPSFAVHLAVTTYPMSSSSVTDSIAKYTDPLDLQLDEVASWSHRSSSIPDPPAAVPDPRTSPGYSVWLSEA